jgi:hypothetical protein
VRSWASFPELVAQQIDAVAEDLPLAVKAVLGSAAVVVAVADALGGTRCQTTS